MRFCDNLLSMHRYHKTTDNLLYIRYFTNNRMALTRQRLLTDFKLFKQMRKQLTESLITHTTIHNVGVLMSPLHDLDPGFIDVRKALCFLKALYKHKFQLSWVRSRWKSHDIFKWNYCKLCCCFFFVVTRKGF